MPGPPNQRGTNAAKRSAESWWNRLGARGGSESRAGAPLGSEYRRPFARACKAGRGPLASTPSRAESGKGPYQRKRRDRTARYRIHSRQETYGDDFRLHACRMGRLQFPGDGDSRRLPYYFLPVVPVVAATVFGVLTALSSWRRWRSSRRSPGTNNRRCDENQLHVVACRK